MTNWAELLIGVASIILTIGGSYALVYRSRASGKAKILTAQSEADARKILAASDAEAVRVKNIADADALITKSKAEAEAVILEAAARAKALQMQADAQMVKDNADRDALVTGLAKRAEDRELGNVKIIGELRDEIKKLNQQIEQLQGSLKAADEALEILKRMEPRVEAAEASSALANQQLTDYRLEEAVKNQPNDTEAAHAAHAVNVQKDYDATQGNAPVVLPVAVPEPVTTEGPTL